MVLCWSMARSAQRSSRDRCIVTIVKYDPRWSLHIAEARVEGLFLKVWRRYGSSALLVAVVVVSILSLSQVQASLFTEWTIPTIGSDPSGIFVDGGLVYFTEYSGNKIGRLDPSTGVFNEWALPTSGSGPEGIFVSGDLVYFAEYDGNKIGLLAFSPVATVTTSVVKTFSTVTTISSVSTASSTFLSSTSVTSATIPQVSLTASTTSVTSSLEDTLTVEAAATSSTTISTVIPVPVGGYVYSVSLMSVLWPMLAVIAVLGCALVAVAVKKRRQ